MPGHRSYSVERYKIVKILEPATVLDRAVTLDHAIYLSRVESKKYPGRRIAVVDTEDPSQTRVLSLGGKTWWAVKCDCSAYGRYSQSCVKCFGSGVAEGVEYTDY